MNNKEKVTEAERAFAKVIARAWSDPEFKESLIKNPVPILRKYGMNIPEGAEVKITEEEKPSDHFDFHFTLPKPPEGLDLENSEIHDRSPGIEVNQCCCCCC